MGPFGIVVQTPRFDSLSGIFQAQDLDLTDGVQGPYRLAGKNNERFIIVIPGSEQVFVDGIQMTRGETNDYVIDYATGEITFTSNRLIREDNRVSIEFQYRTVQTAVGTSTISKLAPSPRSSTRCAEAMGSPSAARTTSRRGDPPSGSKRKRRPDLAHSANTGKSGV